MQIIVRVVMIDKRNGMIRLDQKVWNQAIMVFCTLWRMDTDSRPIDGF
ncbi:hypothetical protein V7O67_05740 [Methanolobus sp. ZRKC4]